MVNWQEADCVVVGEAVDGLEGLEKIRETNPDIVVVDINMPVKDGLSMLEDSIEEYGYDAVIVSGYSDFEYARKAIRLGVTEYLLKPVNFNELYDALRKIKDKQQAAARLRHELKQLDMEKRKLGILDEPETGDSPEGNRHVEYMMDCIRNHYSSHLSLTDISEQCGMSCTYLNSKFKSFTGYTFNDYLNRYRMQKAVDLLKENKYKVYEIADLVGFSDYKYFIKVFKKICRMLSGQVHGKRRRRAYSLKSAQRLGRWISSTMGRFPSENRLSSASMPYSSLYSISSLYAGITM